MALALPTGARGGALALAMTVVAAAAIWVGVVNPIWTWYDERAEQLRRETALAHRMASLVEALPALRQQVALLNGTGDTTPTGTAATDRADALLPGATDPLAAAALQQRIEELAAGAGARVGSEEILPVQAAGDLRAISVRVTLNAPYHSLAAFLLALAQSDTPMVVDELMMRGPAVKADDDDPPVDTNLTVTSYRTAKAEPR